MAPWAKWMVAGPALAGAGIALATWIGAMRQTQSTAEFAAQLAPPKNGAGIASVNFQSLASLPSPVARYFRYALQDRQPMIQLARYRQSGELRTDVKSKRWMPFQADQLVIPPSRSFMWNAHVDVIPLLHVRVLDGYVAGTGSGRVSLLSAFTVGEQRGGIEMNSGSLHRYLAEAVWYPTALLPQAGVQWSAIDDHRALATLTDAGTTVSLEFRFNDIGEVIAIHTPARWGSFDGAYRQLPWEGHFGRYEERGGMRVPLEGEVGWYAADRWQAVWKGRIHDVAYAFSK